MWATVGMLFYHSFAQAELFLCSHYKFIHLHSKAGLKQHRLFDMAYLTTQGAYIQQQARCRFELKNPLMI